MQNVLFKDIELSISPQISQILSKIKGKYPKAWAAFSCQIHQLSIDRAQQSMRVAKILAEEDFKNVLAGILDSLDDDIVDANEDGDQGSDNTERS